MNDEQRPPNLNSLEPPLQAEVNAVLAASIPEDAIERVKVRAKELAATIVSPSHASGSQGQVWRASRSLIAGLIAAAVVLAAVLFLAFCPADFDLHAKGTLEPVDRKDVYAGADGQIDEFGTDIQGVPIEHGSWVKNGQLLLKLRNPTLSAQKVDIDGQVAVERQHAADIRHELNTNGPTLKPDDWARLRGQLTESEQKLSSLKAQADITAGKVADLDLYSPIDGQIETWELKNRLEGRPVQKGQLLLRVANAEGDWELDLHMPEDRMGHIARAKKLANERNEQLTVSYILATEPGTTRTGTVKAIVPAAGVREGDEGNVVLIKVAVNKQDIDPANLRAGAAVTGKVHCGQRSLGYVWFHDLIDLIQVRSNSGR